MDRLRLFADLFFAGLAAALRLRFTGFPVGVGNQSLQIVFLEHLRNPAAFEGDLLLQTLPRFSTWFFHLLARLIPAGTAIEEALALLQGLNLFLLFFLLSRLVRSLWPESRLPWLLLFPFVVSPLQGLAESPINPLAFTHTSFSLTLSLLALLFLLRRHWLPMAVCIGLLGSFHLLTAAYTAAIACMYLLMIRDTLRLRDLLPAAAAGALAALPALPFLLDRSATFDSVWLNLLEIRSAHHIYPSLWWRTGDPAIGQFLLWTALLLLGLGAGLEPKSRPLLSACLYSAALLMALGWIGSELLPTPLILRAQLFRASGYLLLAALLVLAQGCERLLRSRNPAALAAALLLLLCFSLPALLGFRLLLLLLTAWGLWCCRKLPPPAAAGLAAVLLITTLSDLTLQTRFWNPSPPPRQALLPTPAPRTRTLDPWTDIQQQTRALTAENALILTPPRQSGFRLGSRRPIVGEWRDGTQQFFDPDYAVLWDARMRHLDPDRADTRSAEAWIALAQTYGADYIVLPQRHDLPLVRVAENRSWMLCRAERIPPPPLPDPPENAIDPEAWLAQEQFLREVVEPNIRRHRMSGVTLELRDARGRTLPGVELRVEQTRLAFGIGASLNHFSQPAAHSPEFRAPLVHPEELDRFLEVFNYTIIPYSGKWTVIEPRQGERNLDPLDAYLAWCRENDIEVEFHFVSGYEPPWLRDLPRAEQQAHLLRHAAELIDRYAGQIRLWQIVNERRLQNLSPAVFELFRQRHPGALLGVSHCARFFTDREGPRREQDLWRGWDSVTQLQRAGAEVDYFGIHAHRPFGAWWDPRTIYEVLDEYQRRGMRVRITEAGISRRGRIEGSVVQGEWNDDLQAEYLIQFMKVLFSHPNVDAVNFWGFGPRTWQPHIGILDARYQPLPAFEALRQLVQEEWRTRVTLTTARDGRAAFTGFHGDYLLHIRTPDGQEHQLPFTLAPGAPPLQSLTLPASAPATANR